MKVLITGRSGTGKSTICTELQRRGLPAFDGDKVPGLADWTDVRGNRVYVDYSKPINRGTTLWTWDPKVLIKLLTTTGDIYLCGSADNDLDLLELFDEAVALTLPPNVQRQRILNRIEHDYGKQPGMVTQILAEQQQFVDRALRLGVHVVSAEARPAAIVDKILELIHGQ